MFCSKFAKLTLARLLLACAAIKSRGNSLIERKGYCEEALGLFSDLIKLDPSHKRYYEDERSLVLMDQVTWKMFEHFFNGRPKQFSIDQITWLL